MNRALEDVFSRLTNEHVLSGVEACGLRPTGRTLQLNSMENRVYAVELEDNSQVVAKFYRPGRWSADEIMSEHSLQIVLSEEEIPTPEVFDVSAHHRAPTRHGFLERIAVDHRPDFTDRTPVGLLDGFLFCVWKKARGRTPLELDVDSVKRLGTQIGRMHNLFDSRIDREKFVRPQLSSDRLGVQALQALEKCRMVPDVWGRSLFPLCEKLVQGLGWLDTCMEFMPVHGDLHRLNLLDDEGKTFWVVDFDDCVWGPEVQDLWLLASGCSLLGSDKDPLEILWEGYNEVRSLHADHLQLVEPLRTLRMIYYWGWIASRYPFDKKFRETFTFFVEESTWEQALHDMEQQKERLEELGLLSWE